MKTEDFQTYGIVSFTPAEVRSVGSKVADLDLSLMVCAQKMRDELERRMKVLSLTGGTHKPGSEHYQGRALDFTLYPEDGPVLISDVYKAALVANFTGVGIYWNGAAWSFHVDVRSHFAFWSAVKNKRASNWSYLPLTLDESYLQSLVTL